MKRSAKLTALLLTLVMLAGCTVPAGEETTAATTEEITEAVTEAVPVSPLANPNADAAAIAVYEYICSLSGEACLAGQQESTWMGSPDYEMDILLDATGRLPALRGLDYMHDDFSGVNERAIEWWNKGGIVSICWHTGCDFYGEWADALADTIPDWDAVLTEGTAEYDTFIAGMDKAAEALLELQEAGVPVLWRPFHEFDGAWFWWGKGGPENFVRLWQLMYDRYTNYWGLNNLIWVLGYSGNGKNYESWYPGDEYVDIIGADSYNGGVQNGLYRALTRVTDTKPFCFHECGTNPTAEELMTTPWTWFMTWHTDYVTTHNAPGDLAALYNSEYVITLDELPDFPE